jgi:hypothetical protein
MNGYKTHFTFEAFAKFEDLYFGLVSPEDRIKVQSGEIEIRIDRAVLMDKKFIQKMLAIFVETEVDIEKIDVSELRRIWREVKPTLQKKYVEYLMLSADVLSSVDGSQAEELQNPG